MIKKELLIGISIVVVFLYLNYCQSKKIEKQNKMIEKFTTTNYDKMKIFGEESNIEDLIEGKVKKYYGADIDAIRNLGLISEKLASKDGYILPGNITIDGNLKLGGKFNYLPKGSIIAFNGEKAPSGWAICDGNNGQKINGMTIPDLRGKFIYGSGNGNIVGNEGGKDKVKLTIPEMPKHNHGEGGKPVFDYSPGEPRITGFQPRSGKQLFPKGSHEHKFEGEGKPFSIMPPYVVLTYIMKL